MSENQVVTREHLPQRRSCETFNFSCPNGQKYVATVARFADGRIGELFLGLPKAGSEADTSARDAAVVFSIAMQHRVPLEIIRAALMRDASGRPSGPLGAALDILGTQEAAPSEKLTTDHGAGNGACS